MKLLESRRIRKAILDMAYSGATVHIGCSFSIVELLVVLYRSHLRFDPAAPDREDRDYLVLSKGHGVMAQYACLQALGVIPDEHIAAYFKDGTTLKGLADAHVPGVEATCGSLGHGLPVAVGLALGAKLRGSGQTCYAVVGDGELNEGSMWEAIMFASHFHLDNLVIIVDKNGFQAMGSTDEVIAMGSLEEKFRAFGCEVASVDGHDEQALHTVYEKMRSAKGGRPKAIVASSVKGRGVSFMENDNVWHYTRLDGETYSAAARELGF